MANKGKHINYPKHRKPPTLGEVNERFWAKVDKGDGTGCWEWRGAVCDSRFPYGQFSKGKGKITTAHRWIYEQTFGALPSNMIVCHKCDNPRCVRIDHLFAGTSLDNSRDCQAKGRICKDPNRKPRGEAHGMAKLTADAVKAIRQEATTGTEQRDIAKKYGVSQATIWYVIHRKVWGHIP